MGAVNVEARSADMMGAHNYSERAHSPCKFSILLFGHFYKNKASLQKRREYICCSNSLFYMYSVISASMINIVPFIETFDRLRNLRLFRYLINVCRKLSITCNLRNSFNTVINNDLHAAHVYCRQIACFLCVCLSHRGRLIWVKVVKIP